jgi:hypothetical protein
MFWLERADVPVVRSNYTALQASPGRIVTKECQIKEVASAKERLTLGTWNEDVGKSEGICGLCEGSSEG